jgi:hypothetical protein
MNLIWRKLLLKSERCQDVKMSYHGVKPTESRGGLAVSLTSFAMVVDLRKCVTASARTLLPTFICLLLNYLNIGTFGKRLIKPPVTSPADNVQFLLNSSATEYPTTDYVHSSFESDSAPIL